MENPVAPIQQNSQTSSSSGTNSSRLILVAILLFLVGLVLGFFGGSLHSGTKSSSVPDLVDKAGLIEDPTGILKNPIFTEWWGSVEGKLVSKDADSFTIERDGSNIKIYVQKKLTSFYKEASRSATTPLLTLEDVPIGSYMRGTVVISRGSLTGAGGQHITANGFAIVDSSGKN